MLAYITKKSTFQHYLNVSDQCAYPNLNFVLNKINQQKTTNYGSKFIVITADTMDFKPK